MPKPPNRMICDNVSFTIGGEHKIVTNIGRDGETGTIIEIAFCEAGKIGQGIHLLLSELGLKLSRVIQNRDPETGQERGDSRIARPPPRLVPALVSSKENGSVDPYAEDP